MASCAVVGSLIPGDRAFNPTSTSWRTPYAPSSTIVRVGPSFTASRTRSPTSSTIGVVHGGPDRWRRSSRDRVPAGDGLQSDGATGRHCRDQRVDVDLAHPSALVEPHDRRTASPGGGSIRSVAVSPPTRDRCADRLGHDPAEDLADVHLLGGVMDRGDDGQHRPQSEDEAQPVAKLGMTASPSLVSGARTRCSTTRQYVKVPTTIAITRRLNGSRVKPGITRGENCADPCCMISNATEKVMLAKVIVAAATVDNTARALSTVASPTQSRRRHRPRTALRRSRRPPRRREGRRSCERIASATPRRRSTPGLYGCHCRDMSSP